MRAVFFKTDAGAEPVRDWLRTLSKAERQTIGDDLRTVQIGFPMGMPLCRPLGQSLYEVRSSLSTKKEVRLIFFQSNDTLVIVAGFIKKSRVTPKGELDLARQRKRLYELPKP